MKAYRLFAIMIVLLEQQKVSATKLASMFEVSVRTIYRDIEQLSMAGVPIVTSSGANGGISILDNYKVDKNLFTPQEIVAILTGLNSLTTIPQTSSLRSILNKINLLIPQQQRESVQTQANQLVIDPSPWMKKKSQVTFHLKLEQIREAISNRNYIAFIYNSASHSNNNERKIEPYQLVLKASDWYIWGYCLMRQEFRLFRLTRMTKLTVGESFIPRSITLPNLGSHCWFPSTLVAARLLIKKELYHKVLEWCDEDAFTSFDDDHLLVTLDFPNDEYGHSILLSWGEKCQCLAPENVRQEIKHRIELMYKQYHQ